MALKGRRFDSVWLHQISESLKRTFAKPPCQFLRPELSRLKRGAIPQPCSGGWALVRQAP